ncbi:MAG: VOC family protein [Solirubrobacterales bacterium]
MSGVSIDELVLADEPVRWSALGFELDGDRLQLGDLSMRFAGEGAGRGIVSWTLRGVSSTELDGIPTALSDSAPPAAKRAHANGISAIDHVVAMTPALDRSVKALQDAGLDLRRIREQPTPAGAPRQAFFRLGAEILEVVQEPEHVIVARDRGTERPARLWGLAFLAPDLDRTVAALGEHAGEAREAVQPGRRIATVRRSAGLAVPVALMSPKT